jgi:hypothetical protein
MTTQPLFGLPNTRRTCDAGSTIIHHCEKPLLALRLLTPKQHLSARG